MWDKIKDYFLKSWEWIKDNWVTGIIVLLALLIIIWLVRVFWKGIRGNE